MRKLRHITEVCREIYEKEGFAAVCDYANKILEGKSPIQMDIAYEYCKACDTEAPAWRHICLACGQPTELSKQQLVDAVIEDLKKGFALGDYTILDELLNMLQIKNLVQALPEEEWSKYDKLNDSYFEIIHQGWCKASSREEIQIHAGKNGNVFIYQDGDKLGFIVDVYGQNDIAGTMTVWEDDLNPIDDEDEEPIDPNNFSLVEQEDFLDKWGQLTDEVCAELGYEEKNSDDLLMVDYFYYEPKKYWIPKSASLYTPREQSIADYLRS